MFDASGQIARSAGGTMMPLRVLQLGLCVEGNTLLKGIDLTLSSGGCTVIMGPNGAGKSLFLRALHGLIEPTCGSIDWNGLPAAEATRHQSLIFQKPVLLRRSVLANVEFVLKARGLDRSDALAVLEHVGLAHKARQPARLLSGGEQQRLALARALATRPNVLLMDEPTASLDPAATRAIETVVAGACANGLRVILVSHDIGQARRMADDVVFLNAGSIAEHQSSKDFFDQPKSAAARDFLAGRIPA
ncbi:ABC transporter ATP-binding protein [Thalassococcus lentus]|uniref:ATP-binding cassette domain-containing protein n=1 Tax=Thalassococcus lentus TaxID=1210524 RepID=A0ABT4XS83_9RHOB|nr:ATP-binding cassette domain-containing protein [Thalassococcus lentus]MDA7424821.1 ATP-binding cassette domain-containing protein [Thalassococcus lentus]